VVIVWSWMTVARDGLVASGRCWGIGSERVWWELVELWVSRGASGGALRSAGARDILWGCRRVIFVAPCARGLLGYFGLCAGWGGFVGGGLA